MKKILSVILLLIVLIIPIGCGKKKLSIDSKSNEFIELNKPFKVGDYIVTLKNIEYSKSYCSTMISDFLTSKDYYEKDGKRYACSTEIPRQTNHTFLLYELIIEYNGKIKSKVDYCDFELDYNEGYIINPRENYRTSSNGQKWISFFNGCTFEIDPLEDSQQYILRGAFDINNEIKEKEDNSLIMNLPFNLKYKIR